MSSSSCYAIMEPTRGIPTAPVRPRSAFARLIANYDVAQFFGVKLSAIYAMNPAVKPNAIHSGTQVKIPTPTK